MGTQAELLQRFRITHRIPAYLFLPAVDQLVDVSHMREHLEPVCSLLVVLSDFTSDASRH